MQVSVTSLHLVLTIWYFVEFSFYSRNFTCALCNYQKKYTCSIFFSELTPILLQQKSNTVLYFLLDPIRILILMFQCYLHSKLLDNSILKPSLQHINNGPLSSLGRCLLVNLLHLKTQTHTIKHLCLVQEIKLS